MRVRQKIRGRMLAFLMAVIVAVTNVPTAQVYAEEEKSAESSVMKYVVIAQPQVTTPGTQNVVVGLDDSSCATDAVLTYRSNTTGQTLKQTATKMIPGAILFTMDYNDDNQAGEYELLSVTCKVEDVDYTMSMSELNIDARYGVNRQVETTPDGVMVDESEENATQTVTTYKGARGAAEGRGDIEIVTLDGEGNATSPKSISEAIVAVEEGWHTRAKSKDLVVVLDPGHGGNDGGAQGNGLSEKNLNLAIAKYCKAELEKYNRVKVYMTRTTDTYVGLTDRTAMAKNWGADVFVSIHINSSSNPAAHGAEVWYPNPTGDANIHKEGAKLAESIEKRLVALGLGNRGIHYRNYSYDWSVDQNLGDADYYAVIRGAKANGFPGVIVEHAFVSNPSDAENYLGNNSVLKKLGKADATGIAKAYGLSKEVTYEAKDTTVTAKLNGSQTKVTLKASGMDKAGGIKFAVYSEENGKDDLKWYTAKKSDDGWTATARIIDYKVAGKYKVQVYGVPSAGSQYYIASQKFTVSDNQVEGLRAEKSGKSTSKFNIKIDSVMAPSGVTGVQFMAWQKSDKSDLHTYVAEENEDGNYTVKANISKHKYHYGTYRVCAVVSGANGVVTTTEPVTISMKKPKQSTVAKVSGNQSTVKLTVNALEGYKNCKVKGVEVSVWSSKGGKDDLKVYKAKKEKENTWNATVKVAQHKSSGTYRVESYVVLSNGKKYKMSETKFSINAPSVSKQKVVSVNKVKGTFGVQSEVKAVSGIKKVQVAVWQKSDKSDLKWYTAKRQKNGTYKATAHNKNHGDYYGTFYYQIKATDKNGNSITTKKKSYKLQKPKVQWTLKNKSSYTKKQVQMKDVPYAENTKKVQIKVWSEEKGKSFTKTYNAKKKSNGTWYADVKISDFKEAGKYRVTGYVVLKSGKQNKIGSKTFTVEGPSVGDVTIGSINAVEGKMKVKETINSKAPVSKVEIVAWSMSNKSDKHTYIAKKGSDGKYSATIDIKKHDYHYGKYRVYTYVTDKNGIKVRVDKRSKTIKKPVPKANFTADTNSTREMVTISNVPYGKRVKQVKYQVWSEANGQDDVKWYKAKKVKTGQYTYAIPLVNHIDTGKIKVVAYAYFTDGGQEKLLTKRFSIDLYSVAGTTNTNVDQMVRYYNANATYPAFYAKSDAPDIETFAQIYIEECNAEGIRAEVAFAQAMKETGYLRYGGRVPISAYNFAGMGAVDSVATAYATYGSVREGVRAQVQHLKAYANKETLNNPCVDGRFDLVARGTAPYVEWLGQKENPYGKGWATAFRYGYSLRDDYMAKMLRY